MRRSTSLVALALALMWAPGALAEQKPRVAVIPLNFIGVSKADAQVLTELLETGFVKTEAFDVLEQSRIAQILEAQEASIADCTDESCAIEFGKLLAAEQIVLGSASRIGGKYVANGKLIDVTTARNLKADKVEADSLEGLAEQIELLAYKLAGLTYSASGADRIAVAFGELLVESVPEGAEVFVNGSRKGTSPLVVAKVPVGKAIVEARTEGLWGRREVEVRSGELVEVRVELIAVVGRVFVKSPEKEMRVFLDGKEMGSLGTGLVKDVAAGEHSLVLRGEGLYWEGTVTVSGGETETVEAYPREVGSIGWKLPAGARAEVHGPELRQVLYDTGTLENVPAGSYAVEVTARDRDPYRASFVVQRSSSYVIAPELEYTAEYLAAENARARHEAQAAFEARVAAMEAVAQSGEAIAEETVDASRRLQSEIDASGHGFEELLARAGAVTALLERRRAAREREAKIAELEAKRGSLEAQITRFQASRLARRYAGVALLGTGAAAAVGSLVTALVGGAAYSAYQSAIFSSEAEALHRRAESCRIAAIAGGSGAGALSLAGVLFLGGRGKAASLAASLAEVEREIAALIREAQ